MTRSQHKKRNLIHNGGENTASKLNRTLIIYLLRIRLESAHSMKKDATEQIR